MVGLVCCKPSCSLIRSVHNLDIENIAYAGNSNRPQWLPCMFLAVFWVMLEC